MTQLLKSLKPLTHIALSGNLICLHVLSSLFSLAREDFFVTKQDMGEITLAGNIKFCHVLCSTSSLF
mgnify:CR=1 FL=1